MKNTAAFSAAVFVDPRNDAVSAASNTKDTTHPVAPIRRKVRRPNLSTYKAVHVLPCEDAQDLLAMMLNEFRNSLSVSVPES